MDGCSTLLSCAVLCSAFSLPCLLSWMDRIADFLWLALVRGVHFIDGLTDEEEPLTDGMVTDSCTPRSRAWTVDPWMPRPIRRRPATARQRGGRLHAADARPAASFAAKQQHRSILGPRTRATHGQARLHSPSACAGAAVPAAKLLCCHRCRRPGVRGQTHTSAIHHLWWQ